MVDQTQIAAAQISNPPLNAKAISSPSDTVDLENFTRGIYVGGSGNVKVTMAGTEGDIDLTFVGLAAGIIHPIIAKRIWFTGTTATNIIAVW